MKVFFSPKDIGKITPQKIEGNVGNPMLWSTFQRMPKVLFQKAVDGRYFLQVYIDLFYTSEVVHNCLISKKMICFLGVF